MKKSSFAGLVFGSVGGMLFALGMCMALVSQWDAFMPGVATGFAGIVVMLAGVAVWRRMEHKAWIRLTGKGVATVLLSIVGALTLGLGMCFVMVWNQLVAGIVIGMAGILLLLCLIPVCRGLR